MSMGGSCYSLKYRKRTNYTVCSFEDKCKHIKLVNSMIS